VFWFSVKMREGFSPKGRRFRPSGGDFQGIGIYRSDVYFFLEVCGRRRLRIAPDCSSSAMSPSGLSLGMVASPQSLLPFHLT